ncbi:MAG: maleylpyruvate isomerase N-terminal domain-containing protein [Actinomycetota bacterium]
MNPRRTAFIECSEISLALLRSPEVEEHWDEPSALPEFTVRGLAGHLVRGTGSVKAYLDRDEPDGEPIGHAAYYAAAVDVSDIASPLHVAVRERGEEQAAGGYRALLEQHADELNHLRLRLPGEPEDRRVQVFKDLVLLLDDYLATRAVELTVHIDDLAVSVGLPTPELPPVTAELAIGTLVDVARLRHGDLSVLRALARRERDDIEALRVL